MVAPYSPSSALTATPLTPITVLYSVPCRSLCKAAAVTTVMTLVIKVVRRLSKAGRWSSYLVEWLRNSVEYVFSYAICFISIYGLSFSEGESSEHCCGVRTFFHTSVESYIAEVWIFCTNVAGSRLLPECRCRNVPPTVTITACSSPRPQTILAQASKRLLPPPMSSYLVTSPLFVSAGHRVLELFKRRGITTIANDTVLDIGLTALVLGTTVAYLGAAYLLLLLAGSVLGGLGGILVVAVLVLSWFVVNAIMATTIQVLRSSFRAVFVCFVQVTLRRLLLVFLSLVWFMLLLSALLDRRVLPTAGAPRGVLDGEHSTSRTLWLSCTGSLVFVCNSRVLAVLAGG